MSIGTRNNRTRFRVTHGLKSSSEHFNEVAYGERSHEVRKFDRDFRVWDVLQLREWDVCLENGRQYTGRFIEVSISNISTFGCIEGYAILSIERNCMISGVQIADVKP